jgi:hypothetical protein
LLGVGESAIGTMVQCPQCKHRFRVPQTNANPTPNKPAGAPPKSASATEELIVEVELDEDPGKPEPSAKTSPAAKKPVRAELDDEEEVAERDDSADEDEEEKPQKKQKKGSSRQEAHSMVVRNRIMGAVGILGGIALVVWEYTVGIGNIDRIPGGHEGLMVIGGLTALVGVLYIFKK